MSDSDTDVDVRLTRARRRSLSIIEEPESGSACTIRSHHSGETYHVVPELAHCTCPDYEHRTGPCWHVLYLSTSDEIDSALRETVSEAIAHQAEVATDRVEVLETELSDARTDAECWTEAADLVDPVEDRSDPITDLAAGATVRPE